MFTKVISVLSAGILVAMVLVLTPFQPQTNALSKESDSNPFSDVKPNNSHYNAILSLYADGIITGVSNTEYKPNSIITRGEAAQFIVNALGMDTSKVTNPGFSDVPTTHKNYEAIAALYGKGVIGGYTNGHFGPSDSLTRSQIATMLTRAFGLEEATTTKTKFSDVNKLTDSNAKKYIQTLVNYNITVGTTPTTFSPNMKLTRGQLATFLLKAMEVDSDDDFELINVE